MAGADDFDAFVAAHERQLQRAAFLLCGDLHQAQDLVQSTLAEAWRRWDRIVALDGPEFYIRRMLINGVKSWRTRWGRELPEESSASEVGVVGEDLDVRHAVRRAVRELPPGSVRSSSCGTSSTSPRRRRPACWAAPSAP